MKARGSAAAATAAAVLLGLALAHRAAEPAAPRPAAYWLFLGGEGARSGAPPVGSSAAGRPPAPASATDRPIRADVLREIAATGAHVRTASRWLRAVSVDADAATLRRLEALPSVRAIRPVARLQTVGAARTGRDRSQRRPTAAAQAFDSAYYGVNWPALRTLGIPAAHANGFTGDGVRIAILDTGFETRHEAFAAATVVAARDFIGGDGTVYDEPGDPGTDQERHGTRVWSLVGANRPGTLVGTAPDAEFLLARVDLEPADRQADEDRWVAAIEWADSAGADIVLSAVVFRSEFIDKPGYPFGVLNGDITITSRVADEAARRGILVVSAVGNEGPGVGTLAAPADADSVLAVGAVDALGQLAVFAGGGSARGPTADGRTKPELVTRGVGLLAASSTSFNAYDSGLAGTSYAAAIMAGGAAALLEAWPSFPPMDARAALLLAGSRAMSPDPSVGWGLPDIAAAILAPLGIAPVAVATIDLQGNFATIAPTFTWDAPLVHADLRPVRFRVELATDPVFNNIVHTDSVLDASSLTFGRAVRPAQNLWWRVVAESGGIRRASTVAGPLRMPSWVQLLAPDPARVTFVGTPRPELQWAPLVAPAPVGPFTYDVEVLALDGRVLQTVRDLSQATLRVRDPLVPNVAYRWRVIARTRTGQVDTVESSSQFVVTSDALPPATLLYQNFPNPFPRTELGRSTTSIWFDLAERVTVELSVHDLRGRLVRRLIPAAPACGPVVAGPGQFGRGVGVTPTGDCFNTVWDGRDDGGAVVPRGVYVLRLRAGAAVHYRRMIFAPV